VDTHRERRPREAQVYEIDYDHTDGSARRLQVSAAPLAFGDGSFTGALATVSDVTEQRRMEAELRHAILHDPLTGLPNGALLDDRLNQALVRHAGTSEAAVTVLVLDLDQFKMVNDSRGHEAGDQVLVAVAERLHGLVRPQDTVARLGGDAFVIVRVDSDPADGEELAAALLEEIARPVLIDGGKITLSASIGVASCPPYDGADLLRFADTAMFAAKAGGRSQARTFDRRLAEAAERDYALASSLRVALDDELLDMHYQPVVELATGAVVGYEALARWTHRERGEVSPELFVPVAERVGLSRQLDRWAVRRGVRDLQQLRGSDAVAVDAYVAINLSARHLGDEHLESAIVSATENAGLPPGDVCLEITEGAVMHDIQATAQVLTNLRERGYRIAIDDFGTGHSSLAYLRDLPITALKVDRSFVQDMSTDDDVYAIVASIVQMAHAIGVDTVAEGVETLDQARQLRDLGCTAAQGWLWDKAMPAADLAVAPRRYDVPTDGANRPDRRRTRRPQIELTEQHGLSRLIALQGEGASLTTIAAALNSEAYRTPTGQRWHRISVARALRDLLP
jgi:diguanylate cyclase (GGDEF)-like protein